MNRDADYADHDDDAHPIGSPSVRSLLLADEPPPPRPNFWADIEAGVAADQAHRSWPEWRALAAAVVAMIAIGGGLLWGLLSLGPDTTVVTIPAPTETRTATVTAPTAAAASKANPTVQSTAAVPPATESSSTGVTVPARLGTFAVMQADVDILAVYDEPGGPERTLVYDPVVPATPSDDLPFDVLDDGRIAMPLARGRSILGQWVHRDKDQVVVRVVASREVDDETWLQILAPIRPGNRTVWIRSADVEIATTNRRIEIDRGAGIVRVFDLDELLFEAEAVVGRSRAETPLGVTWVDQIHPGPASALGPWVLRLTLFSEMANHYAGVMPVLYLNGTNASEDNFSDTKPHTRVIVRNDDIIAIREMVVVGTPVVVFDSDIPGADKAAIEAVPYQAAATIPAR